MIDCISLTEREYPIIDAQHMVCEHLVRACRTAMYDIALDQESDPDVRREAIQMIKEIHADWRRAQKDLARVLAGRTVRLSPAS